MNQVNNYSKAEEIALEIESAEKTPEQQLMAFPWPFNKFHSSELGPLGRVAEAQEPRVRCLHESPSKVSMQCHSTAQLGLVLAVGIYIHIYRHNGVMY